MEDEDNFLVDLVNKSKSKRVNNSSYISNPDKSSGVVGFKNNDISQYDDNFLPNLINKSADKYGALLKHRASHQPVSHMIGNAAARITNVIPGIIGDIAALEDLGDQFTTNFKAGNVITEWAKKWKDATNEEFPIHRQNPGKALDLGDPAYWIENGSGLINSAIEFGVAGGLVSKGLSGLSKVAKLRALSEAVAKAPGIVNLGLEGAQIGRGAQILQHATIMSSMEGTLTAADTFDKVYASQLAKYSGEGLDDKEAHKKATEDAAQGSAATYHANKWTIPLNILSSGMFMKNLPTRGGKLDVGFKANAKTYIGEGVQEYAEEDINFLAGNYGEAIGSKKEYGFKEIIKDLGTAEAFESGMLGFIGGMGQTAFTKEGVNRIKNTIDPETGEKISIRNYNKKIYNEYKDYVDNLESIQKEGDIPTFTNAFSTMTEQVALKKAYDVAVEKGDTEEAKRLANLSVDIQAYDSFTKGATDVLIGTYEAIRDGEQRKGLPDNYKKKAEEAIQKIKVLEGLYTDSTKYVNQKQVYINKANRYDLENYIEEVNLTTDKVSTSLNGFINKISDLSTDVKGDFNKSGYFLDINNIDFNPAKEAGDTKAAAELEELKTIIKNSGDYKTLLELKEKKRNKVKELKENLVENSVITSKEYQESYGETVTKVRETAEDKIDKQVKTVEKEIKNDEVIKAEADRQAEIAAKNAETEQAIADKHTEVAETVENLNTLADNFNVGETTDLENIFGEAYKGVSGMIFSIEENADGTTTIEAMLDDSTIISTNDKVEPNFKNDNIDDVYNTDGSVDENTSNEESVKTSDDIADNKEADKDGKKLSDVKLMSTYRDSGKTLKGIPDAYVEYERDPIDKTGTKVYFEINKSIGAGLDKGGNFKKATKLYNDFIGGTELSAEDKNFMVDYLPFKAKINNSDTVYTFLESKPFLKDKVKHLFIGDELNEVLYKKASTDLKKLADDRVKSLATYNNRTRPLRISLINHLKNGSDINGLYTTVKGQYGGSIQLDTKGTENNIMDLNDIDSLDDVELYVIDRLGNLVDISGDSAKDWTKQKKNWKGSIYMKTKLANGNPFYLNLNFGKVKTKQAEVIFEVYRSLLQKGNRPTSLISNLAPNIQTLIKKNLKKEIDLITKTENKPFNEIIISEILDLIFWDGSKTTMSGDKNIKSRLRINYETKSVEFGEKSYTLNEFGEDKKAEFVDWVSKNKNRNFKFKPKPGDINQALNSTGIDYLEYAIAEKVINTNAKVNQPLFEGFTNLYLTNGIGGKTAVPKPKVVKAKEPNTKLDGVNNISKNIVKEFEKVIGKHTFIQKNVKGKAGIVNNIVRNNDTGAEIIKATKPDGSVKYFAVGNFPGLPEGFNGLANSKEEVNKVLIQLDIEISNFLGLNNKKSENNDENIRISQNFLVPLQENPLSDEAKLAEISKINTITNDGNFDFSTSQPGKKTKSGFIPDNLGAQIFNAINKTMKGEGETIDKIEAKIVFRELSKKLHPDKYIGDDIKEIAAEYFKKATEFKEKGNVTKLNELNNTFDTFIKKQSTKKSRPLRHKLSKKEAQAAALAAANKLNKKCK